MSKVAANYVELHARSAFSFLRAGSLPEALSSQAAQLGLPALAVCDRMGVYGSPRLAGMERENGVRPIHGAELAMEDGSVLPVLVENAVGYRNLCRLLSRVHLRSAKGEGKVAWQELPEFAQGLVALSGDEDGPLVSSILGRFPAHVAGHEPPAPVQGVPQAPDLMLRRLVEIFGIGNVRVELQRHHRRGEDRVVAALAGVAERVGVPLVATNGVLHAQADGRCVVDVFTCLRHHTTLDRAGALLALNAERRLKSASEMADLFRDLPEAVLETGRLADRLQFRLEDLGYAFPRFPVGPGETMEGVLADWTWRGARQRYPEGVPDRIGGLLRKELALIGKLGFAGYFLLVADLVRFCRGNDILVQGRGSAANSAVCFCLGITAVDPVRFHVLFERFLSEGRKGWPDIDLDLPSGDRRERVIQEVFRRYGPHGAAMTGTIITYRGRSASREIGKVLGFSTDLLDRFSAMFGHGDFPHTVDLLDQMRRAGLHDSHPRSRVFADLYRQVCRLPRHLGQHSGGMVISQDALHQVVPLENAAMPGRVVCQWDKDDCEDLGIIKVDLLGLGMMSVLQDTLALAEMRGRPVDLACLPKDDPETYAMLSRADTIGVFQVESRAQMATLPRLRPACFYDLVVEVAIIRPGPIQGDLAHPYLRRRDGIEPVTYWDERLRPILGRTLGIPLFQEQMLEIAMVLGRFTGDEAEELRKALSFHRSDERMRRSQARLEEAMRSGGVEPEVAAQIAKAVGSFALYGFPESHAISFAHLAYSSAFLKVHRPAEFYCALLNNQPMGFYSPATVVKDARRHGVLVRPVCVGRSEVACRLEPDGGIRLGLQMIRGLSRTAATRLVECRAQRPFGSLTDLLTRVPLGVDERRALAEVGAFNVWAGHRRAASWVVSAPLRAEELPVEGKEAIKDSRSPLAPMDPSERINADYDRMRLTTGPHPMALARGRLKDVWTAEDLKVAEDRQRVRVAGQVICRQRPGTAKGICFVSLEDETGIVNVIVSPELFERERLRISTEPFLVVDGLTQRRHGTMHIRAVAVEWLDLGSVLTAPSHDFR